MKIYIPVFCAIVTVGGVVYTAFSNSDTASTIAALKTDSDERISNFKNETERYIKDAELRSHAEIIRLNNKIQADKEERDKISSKELTIINWQIKKCNEIKEIRDGMANDITHIRNNDNETENAITRLQVSNHKLSSYLTEVGYAELDKWMPKNKSSNYLQMLYDHYWAIVQSLNAEIVAKCEKQ